MEVTIKNQPLTPYENGSYPTLYYMFRFKDHNTEEGFWNYDPIYFVLPSTYGGYHKASDSEFTEVSLSLEGHQFPSGQIDIQAIALIGNQYPTNMQNGTVYGFEGETSDWSNYQTLTIEEAAPAPEPEPEPNIISEDPSPTTFPYAAFDLFPEPNSTDVSLDSNISISISRPAPVVNMSITPKVEVKEKIAEVIGFNGRYTFIFSEYLKTSTTYTVTIIFGVTSAPEGFSPTNSKTWIFTTEAEPSTPTPTTKGPLSPDPISGFFYFILNDIAKGAVPLMLIISLIFVSLVLLIKRFKNQNQDSWGESD